MNADLNSNSLLTQFNLFSGQQADISKTTLNLNTTGASTNLRSTIDS